MNCDRQSTRRGPRTSGGGRLTREPHGIRCAAFGSVPLAGWPPHTAVKALRGSKLILALHAPPSCNLRASWLCHHLECTLRESRATAHAQKNARARQMLIHRSAAPKSPSSAAPKSPSRRTVTVTSHAHPRPPPAPTTRPTHLWQWWANVSTMASAVLRLAAYRWRAGRRVQLSKR